MSARANIGFPLLVRRTPRSEIRKRVDELIELMYLQECADRLPNQLSGGQQQRVALARAIAPSPEVLLLDEPLSSLDAQVRTLLRDELRRLQQQLNITTIFVTHDQSEALAISDRVAVMSKGKIEQSGTPAEVYSSPETRFVASFIGNRNSLELVVQEGALGWPDAFSVAAGPYAEGDRVHCVFQPEDVMLNDEFGGRAVVDVKIFLGSVTRLHCAVAGRPDLRVTADVAPGQASKYAIGDPLYFQVDPAQVRLFPAEEDAGPMSPDLGVPAAQVSA